MVVGRSEAGIRDIESTTGIISKAGDISLIVCDERLLTADLGVAIYFQ